MQCPVCSNHMKEIERQGVLIDLCPGCKGVWLDRGELEKLIALSQREPSAADTGNPFAAFLPGHPGWPAGEREHRGLGHDHHDRHQGHDHGHDREHEHDHDRRYGGHHDHGYGQGPRRRGSWLGDLFGGLPKL